MIVKLNAFARSSCTTISSSFYPMERQLIAVDFISFVLAEIPDGIVGTIEFIVVKPKDDSSRSSCGIFLVTN
jgi:hypothetical protein